jgi:hypothetical protein
MKEQPTIDNISETPKKPKTRRNRIIVGIIGLFLAGCCGLVILGSCINSTPEGQAAATARAEEREGARIETTAIAVIQETEEARPTNTLEATDIPAPTETLPPTSTPLPTNTPEPTSTPVPTITPNPNLVKAGTHIVGSDIQPGIYRGEAGNSLFDSCYWGRMSDLTGDFEALLANDNAIGQFYIHILDTDFAVETKCDLVLLDSIPESLDEYPQVIAPGTYLIGSDIKAGIYRGEAGEDFLESCYWARLRGVSGNFDELLANDNSTGQYFVQVTETDFALSTTCELELTEN